MPAVTETSRSQPLNGPAPLTSIIAKVQIANNGDTWCPGLRTIEYVSTNKPGSVTAAAPDTSTPPNVVFTTAGAVADVLVRVEGYA